MAGREPRRKRRQRREKPSTECCPVCLRAIRQPARGRHKRYCSNTCRQVAYRRRKGEGQKRRLVRLAQADAREFLASLPEESVDLIVTDPPYVSDFASPPGGERFPQLSDEVWPQIFRELYRILAADSHAYVFADRRIRPVFEAAAQAAGFRVHQALIWDKLSIGLGQGAWRSQHEYICFFSKGSRRGNSKSLGDVLRAPRPRGYPTEKPVAVLKQLIAQSSHQGELVLDPFCGSGNVGKAARRLGRRSLLCDVDAVFAAGRLRLVIDQPVRAKT
jgi:site-specific DNA-methyltransferase (adenine-specific)